MKKHLRLFLLAMLTATLLTAAASADIGPKPSVQVALRGLEGRECYGTLLSQQQSTGPDSAWNGENKTFYQAGESFRPEETDEDLDRRWQAFQDFADRDGFYFLQHWWACREESGLNWLYRPPQVFKLVLWFPDTGEYRASRVTEQYAFDSYFTADLSRPGELTLERSYNYNWELISLAARVVITLALELAVAWVFHYRQRGQLRFIAWANLATQLGLNVALNLVNYYRGKYAYVFWFVLLEAVVFFVEALLYVCRLPKNPEGPNHPVAYALAANLVSAAIGMALAVWIPGIF